MITLVDSRFFLWERGANIAVNESVTTWQQLYASIANGLGITLSVDPIASAYLWPSSGFTKSDEYLPMILDWVAASVGQRIVRTLDGNFHARNYTTAQALVNSQMSLYRMYAGGALDLVTDGAANVPESVAVRFPPACGAGTPSTSYVNVTVNLDSLNLASYANVTGRSGEYLVHSTAVASYAANDSVVNQAELTSLANQIAADFYNWRFSPLEIRYEKAVPWVMDGIYDVEWVHRGYMMTSVRRSAWQPVFGKLMHAGTFGSASESCCGPVISIVSQTPTNGTYFATLQDLLATSPTWASGANCWAVDLNGSTALVPGTLYNANARGELPGGPYIVSVASSNAGNALTDIAHWVTAATNPTGAIPAWAAGTFYLGQIVAHHGTDYICAQPFTTGTPGSSGDWVAITLTNQGPYSLTKSYAAGNFVQQVLPTYSFASDVDAPSNTTTSPPSCQCPTSPSGGGPCDTPFNDVIDAPTADEMANYPLPDGDVLSTWTNSNDETIGLFELYAPGNVGPVPAYAASAGSGGGAYSASVLPLVAGGTYTVKYSLSLNAVQVFDPSNTVILQAELGYPATDMSSPGRGGLAANGIGQLRTSGGNGAPGTLILLYPYPGGGGGGGGPSSDGGNGITPTSPVYAGSSQLGGADGGGLSGVGGGGYPGLVISDSATYNGQQYGGGAAGGSLTLLGAEGLGYDAFPSAGPGGWQVSFGACAILPTPASTPSSTPSAIATGINARATFGYRSSAFGIYSQLNVNTITSTRVSSGKYKFVMTISFVSADSYSVGLSAIGDALEMDPAFTQTANSFQVLTVSGNDIKWGSFMVSGDLLGGTGNGSLGGPVSTAPTVNFSNQPLAINAATVNITGSGFNATAGSNTVVLSLGAVATVTSVTGTTAATLTFSTAPIGSGILTCVLYNGSAYSGAAVEIASVYLAPTVTMTTTDVALSQTTVTVTGTGFGVVASAISIAFTGAFSDTLTAATVNSTGTSLTVTVPNSDLPMTAGSLNAVVTVNGASSGSPIQVATAVTSPTLTMATTGIDIGTTTLTLAGTGEDGSTPANNVVTFSGAATGSATATASSSTSATVPVTLTNYGNLYASISVSGVSSGAPVQVRTVTAAPSITANTGDITYNATSLVINGANFSPIASSDTVYLWSSDGTLLFASGTSGGPTGNNTITAASATSLTLSVQLGFPVSKTGQTLHALVITPAGQSSAVSPISSMAVVATLVK
jgi:hypothetical protein